MNGIKCISNYQPCFRLTNGPLKVFEALGKVPKWFYYFLNCTLYKAVISKSSRVGPTAY